MRTFDIAVIGTVAVLVALGNQAPAQPKKTIAFSALPQGVQRAVKQSTLNECEWKTIEPLGFGFKLSGVDDDKKVIAMISPAGEFYQVGIERQEREIPESVLAALRVEEPNCGPSTIYSVGPFAGAPVYYELSNLHFSPRSIPPSQRKPGAIRMTRPSRKTLCITVDGLVLTDAARHAVIRQREQIPAEALKRAEKAAPGVKWSFFASKLGQSKTPTLYLLLGRDSQDRRVQVIYEHGAIREVGVAMKKLDDVPPSVLAALRQENSRFEARRADALGPDSSAPACYEFAAEEDAGRKRLTVDGLFVPDDVFSMLNDSMFLRPQEIPAEVQQVVEKMEPGFKWTYTTALVGAGKPGLYFLVGRNSQGQRVQVNYVVANGQTGARTDIRESDVPAKLRDAVKTKVPDLRTRLTQALRVGTNEIVAYLYEGWDAAGKAVSVNVELDGTVRTSSEQARQAEKGD